MTSVKLDGIKASAKDGWEEEADRLTSLIEKDKAGISQQLARRVFIRAWYVFSCGGGVVWWREC